MSRFRYRERYRFMGRWGGRYHWYRRVPGDSRIVEVSCPVAWFWETTTD